MKTFIWRNCQSLTEHYHNSGSLLIVARDLEQARWFLREAKRPNGDWYQGSDEPTHFPLVPENCGAYTSLPSYELDAGNEPSGLVLVFPNKGCC